MYHQHLPGEPLFCKPTSYDLWMQKEGNKIIKKIMSSPANRCFCCSSRRQITSHHIIPKHCGGLDIKNNIVHVCKNCHEEIHFHNHDQKNDLHWLKLIINMRNRNIYKPQSNTNNNKEDKK